MRTLVIGANGFVGSGVARRLKEAGHEVHGLARDEAKADSLRSLGYTPVMGDFGTAALLRAVETLDGVINSSAVPFDREWALVEPILERLSGTQKPYVQTTGTGVLAIETPNGEWREESFAEDDPFTPLAWIATRVQTEINIRAYAARGVRTMVVRPPMIWGLGGSAQIPAMLQSLRTMGAPCYIGQGLNLYSHVHVDDLGDVHRLALERGAAGALYHAVAGEACWRVIANAIGRVAGREARSVSIGEARTIWGDLRGPLFFGVSSRSRAPRTRAELGWSPRHTDVTDDIENGSYRAAALEWASGKAETEQ